MKGVYPDSAIVGERIKEVRKQNKMSQTALAQMLKKSLRTIQKYESGQIDLTITAINEIAVCLNVSPAYLLGYDPNTANLQSLSDFAAYLFELDKKKELRFDIETGEDRDGWKCSITFDGLDHTTEHNSVICQLLTEFQLAREEYTYCIRSTEEYENWKNTMLNFHSRYTLQNRVVDDPDQATRSNLQFEYFNKKMARSLKNQSIDHSDESETK